MSVRLIVNVYRTAVPQVKMYGSKARAMKKAHDKIGNVVEIRFLLWMCRVTKKES